MVTPGKRRIAVGVLVAALLLIPLVAMQFTTDVNWTLSDFVIAGVLLLGTGLLLERVLRNGRTAMYRIAACTVILVVFALVWLELAVGIFGTPFAGQ